MQSVFKHEYQSFLCCAQYPEDLWRCGNPIFFGADEPEEETDIDENGLPIFWRAPFPGLPFTANRFDGDGNPLEACTPSIAGSAATSHTAALAALLAAAAALASMLV
ncbi:unnamed protein product [Symbiodinium sp. KB8]|nr:unnamed protein product [Symbiodinium sp. KB8]